MRALSRRLLGSPLAAILTLQAALMLSTSCGSGVGDSAAESEGTYVRTSVASRTSNFSAWSEPVSLGFPIDATGFNDQQPALSKDGLSLYFASTRPEPSGLSLTNIWVSQRACDDDSCPWGTPVSLGPTVNTSVSDFAPVLSRDGHYLFLASGRSGGGSQGSSDIWVSRRTNVHDDFGWGTPVNVGPGINTAGFEGGPAYFENDDLGVPQLYFNHNDAPSNAGGDIYVSEQAADGSWSRASPVVELNSAASDQRPSVAHSGLDIYFFSNREGSVRDGSGALSTDIWVSTRESVRDPWSTPTNLGLPINTSAPEVHPFIFSNGRTEELYFVRTVSTGDNDIFVSRRTRGGRED